MYIVYILTYDCNFRCKYCDVSKQEKSISEEILKQSIDFFKNNNFDFKKIKFFWGEPLLEKENIKFIVDNFSQSKQKDFYLTTNSSLVDDDFVKYSLDNNIKLTFSIDGDSKNTWVNRVFVSWDDASEVLTKKVKKYSSSIRVNQVITSENSKYFFENFKFIYDLWIRKFNFLPAFYTQWSKEGLTNLREWFEKIKNFYYDWNDFELINLENYSETSFFNFWIIIDTDGGIYWTNLIMYDKFKKYKNKLKIWDVFKWIDLDFSSKESREFYMNSIWKILEKEYNFSVLKSVKFVDLILNHFCNNFKKDI